MGRQWHAGHAVAALPAQLLSQAQLGPTSPFHKQTLLLNSAAAVMTEAFQAIWAVHTSDGVPLRTAAFVVAIRRVAQARLARGFD